MFELHKSVKIWCLQFFRRFPFFSFFFPGKNCFFPRPQFFRKFWNASSDDCWLISSLSLVKRGKINSKNCKNNLVSWSCSLVKIPSATKRRTLQEASIKIELTPYTANKSYNNTLKDNHLVCAGCRIFEFSNVWISLNVSTRFGPL